MTGSHVGCDCGGVYIVIVNYRITRRLPQLTSTLLTAYYTFVHSRVNSGVFFRRNSAGPWIQNKEITFLKDVDQEITVKIF